MPKIAKELTPLAVSKIRRTGLHAVGGVNGLGLKVMPSGSRAWVLRTVVAGKRREYGLGGYWSRSGKRRLRPPVAYEAGSSRFLTTRQQRVCGKEPTQHDGKGISP